ncbi:MAG TPA: universal stress protein [Vicinamibacterales bacterium]|nr:universal stress protein [Vicinamibacterales bacterium]
MIHIKHILCPVDFSDFSRHAFDRAVAIARSYGADLTVLHVLPVASPVPALPYGPEGPGPFGFEAVGRDRALAELPRFLAADQSIGVPLHYVAAESPSVQKEILLQTERLAADLVVMGTHGRSGFDRFFLGSVAEKTLRTSPVPVLVVPPHVPAAVPDGRDPFRSIVCAVDFSEDSARALGYAASLARHAAGRLTLLHSVEPMPVASDPLVGVNFDVTGYQQALEKSATATLQKFVPQSIALGCDTETVVASGKAYREILRVATERQADLIVLGVHGRNVFDRMVFGSTTEHIVRRATCPVLAVPALTGQ